MDTLILQRPQAEKTATSAAGIGIAICLLLAQNLWISAKDIGGITGITPPSMELIKEKRIVQEQLFEEEIAAKYKNYNVSEVEKGVKHVRMTKYYNGKPVRINIVEVSPVTNNLGIEPATASSTLASRRKILIFFSILSYETISDIVIHIF